MFKFNDTLIARGTRLQIVHRANDSEGRDQHAIAKPIHSTISPTKTRDKLGPNRTLVADVTLTVIGTRYIFKHATYGYVIMMLLLS